MYRPPFTIAEKMTVLVAGICEEIGRISVLHDGVVASHLSRKNRIRTIHSSL